MDLKSKELIEKLNTEHTLSIEEYQYLLENIDEEVMDLAADYARVYQQQYYGNKVYTRGLVEFTNFCRNNCYYCGIRRENNKCERYRLATDDILECPAHTTICSVGLSHRGASGWRGLHLFR